MSGLGVDIHPYYQRGTNALPGVEYGWIKMADGAAVYSKKADGKVWTADAHAALFRRLGIPFGGYEFAQLGTDGGKAFDVLWGECQRLGGTGVTPGVDIEGEGWNKANATDRGRSFCSRARARGVRPAVYMDLTLLQQCRADLWPEDPVIWAPRYGAKPEMLLHGVQYTGHYDVHQYTSSGSLPGSAGAVDWNQAYTNEHLMGDDMTPQEFLDTKVTWWDGHTVAIKDILAEVYIAGRGLNGRPAFGDQKAVVQLPPVQQLLANDAAEAASLAAIEAATKDPGITVEAMRTIVSDAVAQRINITGELHIGPAGDFTTPTEPTPEAPQ